MGESVTELLAEQKRQLMFDLIARPYRQAWQLAELRREFRRYDYVKLPQLFTEKAFQLIRDEVNRLEQRAFPRDFVMDEFETVRRFGALDGSLLLQYSPMLWSLYWHHAIISLIEAIAGTRIYPCQHPQEFMVTHYMVGDSAQHGWHTDDPAYGFLIIIDAPPPEQGGLLEMIPRWRDFCEQAGLDPVRNLNPSAERARQAGFVRQRHHATGDAYLFRADLTLHQVTPIIGNGRRVILNMAYDNTPEPQYGITATRLYDYDR